MNGLASSSNRRHVRSSSIALFAGPAVRPRETMHRCLRTPNGRVRTIPLVVPASGTHVNPTGHRYRPRNSHNAAGRSWLYSCCRPRSWRRPTPWRRSLDLGGACEQARPLEDLSTPSGGRYLRHTRLARSCEARVKYRCVVARRVTPSGGAPRSRMRDRRASRSCRFQAAIWCSRVCLRL